MPSSLGPAEILVILVVALIVLGPKRLPEAGRQVGKALSEIRRWTQDMKAEVTSAFDADQAAPSAPPVPPSAPYVPYVPPPIDVVPPTAAPEPRPAHESEPTVAAEPEVPPEVPPAR